MNTLTFLAPPAVRPAAPEHAAAAPVRPPLGRCAAARQLPVQVVATPDGAAVWFIIAVGIGLAHGATGESPGGAGIIDPALAGLIVAGCAAHARHRPAHAPRLAALCRFHACGLDTATGRMPAGAVLAQVVAMPLLVAALLTTPAVVWRLTAG